MNPEPERGADHPHGVRTLFRSGDIGDVGLRDGNISAGDSREDARDEKQRERFRQPHQGKADRSANDADQQDRTTAEPVG